MGGAGGDVVRSFLHPLEPVAGVPTALVLEHHAAGRAPEGVPVHVQAQQQPGVIEILRRIFEVPAQAGSRGEHLGGLKLVLTAKVGSEGKLFGSIGPVDIAEAAELAGVTIERSELRLAEGPLRTVGEHEVEVHLHAEVSVPITVTIEAEE